MGEGCGWGKRPAPAEQTSDSSDTHTRKTPSLLEAFAKNRDPTVPSMAQAGNHPFWALVLRGGGVGSA